MTGRKGKLCFRRQTDRQTDRRTDRPELTGYPSIDKPWLKYYKEEFINEPLPQCSMYEYMFDNNKDRLNATALNYFGRKITYQELFNEIEKAARAFQAYGIKPGDVVTLIVLSCMPSVACLYGLNRIGAVSNYVNVLSSEDDLAGYIKDGNSRLVIALDLFGAKALAAAKKAGAEKVIFFSLADHMPVLTKLGYTLKTAKLDKSFLNDTLSVSWDDFLKSGKDHNLKEASCPDDICFYGHTGGTTGVPKTVLLKNMSFNTVAHNYNRCFERNTGDPFLNTIVPFVTYGTIINTHMPLCLGLETVLLPKFDANDWPKYIKKYHIKHLGAIPAYVEPMTEKLEGMDLSCLRTVAMGGEGMNVPLEEKLNAFLERNGTDAKIIKGYGLTEVCTTAVTGFPYANKIGSVGIPLMTNNFMIYDNDSQSEMGYNQSSEVCMQCKSVMAGYKDNPEERRRVVFFPVKGCKDKSRKALILLTFL